MDGSAGDPYSELKLFVLILIRRYSEVPPIFFGEFIVEDLILLLILIGGLAAPRFREATRFATGCLLSVILVDIIWPSGRVALVLLFLVFLLIHIAVKRRRLEEQAPQAPGA